MKQIELFTDKFNLAIQNNEPYVFVMIRLPGGLTEVIVNENKNFEEKLSFYETNYDENLKNKRNSDIEILSIEFGELSKIHSIY